MTARRSRVWFAAGIAAVMGVYYWGVPAVLTIGLWWWGP